MVHAVLIGLHAAAGVVAFVAGGVAVSRCRSAPGFAVYYAGLVGLAVFLAAAVGLDWPGLGAAARAGFAALTVLAGYLVWRAERARQLLAAHPGARTSRYVDHVGFTLVALFDGFAVIAVVVNGGPGWAAAVVGVAGVLTGHLAIRRLKHRLSRQASETGARHDQDTSPEAQPVATEHPADQVERRAPSCRPRSAIAIRTRMRRQQPR